MIKIDKIEDGLPISVVVPHISKRDKFFTEFSLPSIEGNYPAEIIVVTDEGSATKQRNIGLKKASQPYVFFCDDDCILPANLLEKLYNKLVANQIYAYAYCGYDGIVTDKNTQPPNNFSINSMEFNPEILRQYNYISTMSLFCRECTIPFDETLKRFQDWDLYLSLLSMGKTGIFVSDVKFMAFFNDSGITNNNNSIVDAHNIIKLKHKL